MRHAAAVILIFGINVVGCSVDEEKRAAQIRTAKVETKMLSDCCKMFRLNIGSFPTSLEELSRPASGLTRKQWGGPYLEKPVARDPWLNPYTLETDETTERVVVASNGPDGQAGTEDDISSEQ